MWVRARAKLMLKLSLFQGVSCERSTEREVGGERWGDVYLLPGRMGRQKLASRMTKGNRKHERAFPTL